jgi:hypothetical protein
MGSVQRYIHKAYDEKYTRGHAEPLSGIQLVHRLVQEKQSIHYDAVPHALMSRDQPPEFMFSSGQSFLGLQTHHPVLADLITRRLNLNISNLISYKSKIRISSCLRLGGLQHQFHVYHQCAAKHDSRAD